MTGCKNLHPRCAAVNTAALAWFLFAILQTAFASDAVGTIAGTIRVATFNTSLNRSTPDGLALDLQEGTLTTKPNEQIANIARIIRRVRPDIILLNEFDYSPSGLSIRLFKQNYLELDSSLNTDHPAALGNPVVLPYHFVAPSNTGVPSGVDFKNDSTPNGDEDVFGYGKFPGQYGMAVLSKYPIVHSQVRTFQKFLWRDMPHAAWPMTTDANGNQKHYYSAAARSVFRLSSKSHWDIPINIDGATIHLLASHPTPPVFDGPEDRNGLRNHDEIRFWADYVSASENSYIYDDDGNTGGLPEKSLFIIAGDLNASATEGESTGNPIQLLTQQSRINDSFTPVSPGAAERNPDNVSAPAHTTAWSMRVDYILPSHYGFRIEDGGVYWPSASEPENKWVTAKDAGTDHRLVWLDLTILTNQTSD